jgi:putative DNA primase/helicase
VQQLWAEVATLFRAGEHWWLERHEEASLELLNREHEAVDPIEELILKRYPWGQVGAAACKPMNATDVLIDIGMNNKLDRKHTTEVAKILRKLTGGEPKKARDGKYYDVPQHGGPL